MAFGFGRSSHRTRGTTHTTTRRHHGFRLRKDPDRVAGGYSTYSSYHSRGTFAQFSLQRLLWPTPTLPVKGASTPSGSCVEWYAPHASCMSSGRLTGLSQGRGNEAHVPLMTKIKRTLGIRSSPRTSRNTHTVSSTSRMRRTRRTRY